MERFAKIVYGLKLSILITIFEKRSVWDIWQDSKYSLCTGFLIVFCLLLMLYTFCRFYMKTDGKLDGILGKSKAVK